MEACIVSVWARSLLCNTGLGNKLSGGCVLETSFKLKGKLQVVDIGLIDRILVKCFKSLLGEFVIRWCL